MVATMKYREIKIGEVIPFDAEFYVGEDIWFKTTAGGSIYNKIRKIHLGLKYRAPILNNNITIWT